MPAAPQTTYIEVVQLALQSVGHPKPVDVAGSQDEAVLRCGWYANQAGTELKDQHNWNELNKPGSISIFSDTPGQTEKAFDLPDDFDAFVDDTQWDRSSQLPAIGPVNPQDWQWLVVREAMITTRFMWRLRNKQFWIKSPPETPTPFTFEYLSLNWAYDSINLRPSNLLVNNSDYHIYPWQLMVLLTRWKWLSNEGYDGRQAKMDYDNALEAETGSNLGNTALSLVPGIGYPFLTPGRNLPDTGYGF